MPKSNLNFHIKTVPQEGHTSISMSPRPHLCCAVYTKVLTNFIGIVSGFVLNKKAFSRKNTQAIGASSKEQTILIGYGEHTRALLGQFFRRIKDPHFLQCSKLKVLFRRMKQDQFSERKKLNHVHYYSPETPYTIQYNKNTLIALRPTIFCF